MKNVPLGAWNERFFRSIVGVFGSSVRCDEDTINKSRFDVARILISSSTPNFSVRSMDVLINEVATKIWMEEDSSFEEGVPNPTMTHGESTISGFTSSSDMIGSIIDSSMVAESENSGECSGSSDQGGGAHEVTGNVEVNPNKSIIVAEAQPSDQPEIPCFALDCGNEFKFKHNLGMGPSLGWERDTVSLYWRGNCIVKMATGGICIEIETVLVNSNVVSAIKNVLRSRTGNFEPLPIQLGQRLLLHSFDLVQPQPMQNFRQRLGLDQCDLDLGLCIGPSLA